jgi:hypothetical protein
MAFLWVKSAILYDGPMLCTSYDRVHPSATMIFLFMGLVSEYGHRELETNIRNHKRDECFVALLHVVPKYTTLMSNDNVWTTSLTSW